MITYKNILYSVTKILSDNFNCDVIVEKPMTIDTPQCKQIFEAEKRSG